MPAGGNDVLAAELLAFCRERLAHYECPRSVDFAALPRHHNGKLYKREQYRAAGNVPAAAAAASATCRPDSNT